MGMSILAWVVVGGLAGWIASMIMGANARMGIFANIIVGIVGAFIGGFVMNLLGQSGATGINLYSVLVSILGACILLFIINKIR